jgi:cellulose biosynthesis protein BcsQ
MRNEDFDFIIDTPGSLTLQGLLPLVFEADAVIVPIQLEKTSINSTTSFVEMCAMVAKENGGDKLPDFYFLPNQFNKNWGRKAELTSSRRSSTTSPSWAPYCRRYPTAPRSSATARSSSPTSNMRLSTNASTRSTTASITINPYD